MIDTIKGYIELTEEHSINMAIFEQGYVTSSSTGYRTARLDNFTVKVKFNEDNTPVRLKFIGSLPKLYYGNNLAQLDWEATQDALQMLSDNLHIDIFEANLTRIDFGFNFLLKRNVQCYLNLLCSRTRFRRLSYQDETVGFSSKAKTIIFYDKLEEIKKRDKSTFENIPELYKGLNVLRCEVKLLKNIRTNLGTKLAVKVKDLTSKRTQKKLAEIFFSEFSKVHTSDDLDPLHFLKKHNGVLKYLSFRHSNVRI